MTRVGYVASFCAAIATAGPAWADAEPSREELGALRLLVFAQGGMGGASLPVKALPSQASGGAENIAVTGPVPVGGAGVGLRWRVEAPWEVQARVSVDYMAGNPRGQNSVGFSTDTDATLLVFGLEPTLRWRPGGVWYIGAGPHVALRTGSVAGMAGFENRNGASCRAGCGVGYVLVNESHTLGSVGGLLETGLVLGPTEAWNVAAMGHVDAEVAYGHAVYLFQLAVGYALPVRLM